jgi:hypothetical protein
MGDDKKIYMNVLYIFTNENLQLVRLAVLVRGIIMAPRVMVCTREPVIVRGVAIAGERQVSRRMRPDVSIS